MILLGFGSKFKFWGSKLWAFHRWGRFYGKSAFSFHYGKCRIQYFWFLTYIKSGLSQRLLLRFVPFLLLSVSCQFLPLLKTAMINCWRAFLKEYYEIKNPLLSWEKALFLMKLHSLTSIVPLLYLNTSRYVGSAPIKKAQTSKITPSENYHWISHRRGRAAIPLQPKGRRGMPLQTTHTSSPLLTHNTLPLCPHSHDKRSWININHTWQTDPADAGIANLIWFKWVIKMNDIIS